MVNMWIIYLLYGWIVSFKVNTVLSAYGIYNISLQGKQTKQSSTYHDGGGSNLAVDGSSKTIFDDKSCSHTETEPSPWWAVDIGEEVTLYSVNITNRGDCCGERLNNFLIYGSRNNFIPDTGSRDKELCYNFSGQFGLGATETFLCSHPIRIRFLSIELHEKNLALTLCEVGITAVCPDGTYGNECAHRCSPNCLSHPCDKFSADGKCEGGSCKSGFTGHNCSAVCQEGTYGQNCLSDCSENCRHSCDPVHGYCANNECKAGYQGRSCRRECPDRQYGDRCKYRCSQNCKHQPCDKFTDHGACRNGDCKPGYTGENCRRECPPDTYGIGCQHCSPYCLSGSCDRITGECPLGLCVPGYLGGNCSLACPLGTYGSNCLLQCFPNCKAGCEPMDGRCKSGCQDGWAGYFCDIKSNPRPQHVVSIVLPVITLLIVLVLAAVVVMWWIVKKKSCKADRALNPVDEQADSEAVCFKPPNDSRNSRYENPEQEALYVNEEDELKSYEMFQKRQLSNDRPYQAIELKE